MAIRRWTRGRSLGARLRFAALGALLVPCACSLLTSVDGLSGGTSAIPVAPVGDADVAEGSTPADAGGDAGDGGATPFCATLTSKPALCADFDGDDPLSGWIGTTSTGPGSLFEASAMAFKSAPRAGRARLGPAGVFREASVLRSLGDTNHLRLSYALYIDERPTVSEYEVNLLRFRDGNGLSSDFYLSVAAGGAKYVEQVFGSDGGGGSVPIPLTQPIPTRKWTQIVLEVTLVGTKSVVVTVDGVEAARQAIWASIPGQVDARAGITYANTGIDRGAIYVDNFVVEQL